MVKGTSRRVIVVDSPDTELFEQAIFIVGQKRLRNAELFRGLALGDPLFLPQQGKGAGKVSIHGNNLVK